MFTYLYNSETYTVQLERLPDGTYRATVGARTYIFTAEAVEGGWTLRFPVNGTRTIVYAADDGTIRHISLHGETYILTRDLPHKGKRAATLGAHGGDVTAQMPGQIRELLVSAGDTVERGQTLLLLEAMKMEVRVASPADGVVKRVLVAAGDVVSRGQLLAEIG